MSINLYLLEVSQNFLESVQTDNELVRKVIEDSLQSNVISQADDFKRLYASQGIFSVEDFIEKNPYVHTLEPELKKETLKRVRKVFRKNKNYYKGPLALGKSWHMIHFLLSGEVWSSETPLGGVLMGGTEIGDESFNTGYGVPRFHSPAEVKRIAEILPTLEQLKENFAPEKFVAADIYAFNPDNADEEWEYLSHFYRQLFDYFHDAARRENAMLLISC